MERLLIYVGGRERNNATNCSSDVRIRSHVPKRGLCGLEMFECGERVYEMQLATSPLLCAGKIVCSWRDTDGDNDSNKEAIMEITGMVPSLREVIILAFEPMLASRYLRPRQTWQGLQGCMNKSRSFDFVVTQRISGFEITDAASGLG